MSICRVFSCVFGRGCLLWPVHFLGKTLLVFALLHSVFQGQICLLLQVFLDFLPLHWSLRKAFLSLLATLWKRHWFLEGLGARGEGDDRGWDGWIASLTWWTWDSVNSGSWWWTGKPGVLQSMGLQRIIHDWATELKWTEKKTLRRGGKNTQKNYTKKILMTWITTMVWSSPRARHFGVWSQGGLRKHHNKQS